MLSRRGLFGLGVAFVAAPAIVRVSSLMPVSPRAITPWLYRGAYQEIAIDYAITRKAISDSLYKSQFHPSNLALIESFQPTVSAMDALPRSPAGTLKGEPHA